jgi:DNA-binding IclR family transcriptional regulator
MIFKNKDEDKDKIKNGNKNKVLQMFLEYSESDTPYISRTYISEILDIPINKVITILNNLVIQNKIKYDPETNKYCLKDSN